jgi:hypothetical protein
MPASGASVFRHKVAVAHWGFKVKLPHFAIDLAGFLVVSPSKPVGPIRFG